MKIYDRRLAYNREWNYWCHFNFLTQANRQGQTLCVKCLQRKEQIDMKKQAFYHGVVDDTSPVYSSQNVDLIETVINHDLHELNSRSSKWLMSHKPQHYILWFVLVMLLRTYIFFIALNLRKITRLFLYLPFVNISDLSFSKMLNEMNI